MNKVPVHSLDPVTRFLYIYVLSANMSFDSVVLAKRPKANIIVGETFKTVSKPLPDLEDLKDGELLIEVLYLSLDPAMRGWLNGT